MIEDYKNAVARNLYGGVFSQEGRWCSLSQSHQLQRFGLFVLRIYHRCDVKPSSAEALGACICRHRKAMAGRGRLFSRKYEQTAKPTTSTPEELANSKNPLVQLGLAFKKLQKLAPESVPAPQQANPPGRPLVDINDVRKYLRAKLAITKQVSTIPTPNPSYGVHHLPPSSEAYESSETTHLSSKHSYSSDASELPKHDAATGARPFDIGTVGHPILEVPASSPPTRAISEVSQPSYAWIPPAQLEMRDVQEWVRGVLEVVKRFENWGLPQTSWENKMPWYSPPPKLLARGLQRPPERFSSDEEKLAFNRLARKRKKFLTGCPPTWSFMVANLALIAFLVYNPLG